MGRFMFLGLLFVLTIVIHENDCKALPDGHPSWFQAPKPLVRRQRDLPGLEEMLGNDTWVDYDACNEMMDCHYEVQNGDLYDKMESFRIGEFYENLDSWCSPRTGCLDDDCHSAEMKSQVESGERIINWVCSHREAFRETACYRDPFSKTMQSCERMNFQHGVKQFESCVMAALDELPGCSRDNGFADLFRFAMIEMREHF